MVKKAATLLVLKKINELRGSNANFAMTRWIFEWKTELSIGENLTKAEEEQDALDSLEAEGCIEQINIINPLIQPSSNLKESPDFSDYVKVEGLEKTWGYRTFRKRSDYRISNRLFKAPELDRAWEHLEWATWITKLNPDRYYLMCLANKYDPISNGAEAQLEFENLSIPVITINGFTYKCSALRATMKPAQILEHCLNEKPNTYVNLKDLKVALRLEGVDNLNRVFYNTEFNNPDHPLSSFVKIEKHRIRVSNTAYLDFPKQEQLSRSAILIA